MTAEVGENALDIALKVARALTAVGAEYFLGGSLASSLQGEPRATNDIDFVISLPAPRINTLRDALGADFEVDTDMLRDAVLHARSANAFYLEGGSVSEKQWRDIVGVLRISRATLDNAYVDQWAARLNLTELLTSARNARSPELSGR